MSEINFINDYVPASEELSQEKVQDSRTQIQDLTSTQFPDLATSPGTVLGDLIVTPQAYLLAQFQEGMNRFISDLCLQNVAGGIVYNCDFVQQYINNFGVDTSLYYPSSGIVRLTFDTDKDYKLDRSTQFKLNNSVYSIYFPTRKNGDFICYSTESVMPDTLFGSRLKQLADGRFFCDVPVIGNVGDVDIPATSLAQISVNIPELSQAVALIKFSNGVKTNTIENLAKNTQTTMYSASLNTRNGAIQYVKAACPFIESVFAVRDGDRELLRTYRNHPEQQGTGGFGVSTGSIDVYARSQAYEFTETQVVKLTLRSYDNGDEYFEGWWDYEGQPYHIESITNNHVDSDQLDHTIISYNDCKLGAMVSYSEKEKLYVKVNNVHNGDNMSDFMPFLENGEWKAYFNITYQTDPFLPSVQQTLKDDDYTPINASILVRGFIPVIIENFQVVYVKKGGVVPDLQWASDQIKIYLAGVGAPRSYTDAAISKIMDQAGVGYTKRINVQARVQWSVADYVLKLDKDIPTVNPGEIDDGPDGRLSKVPQDPLIRDSDGLRITYPNIGVPITADMMYSCSPRNIRYFVLENAIKFKEVIDV